MIGMALAARPRSARSAVRGALGSASARCRGFTLAELMAVVAIMGVLATIAITAFHRKSRQSDVAQGKVFVKAIVVAQEHYRAANQVYFDAGNAWYPQATIPVNTKVSFWKAAPDGATDPDTVAWRTLGPDIRQMVGFSFKANANLPDTPPPSIESESGITFPANVAVEPWYLIQARADADGDSTYCYIAAASWAPEIAVSNEGE